MQRPTFSATAVIDARRNPDQNNVEFNLIDAKGNTQTVILDQVAVGHVLTALLQKSQADGNVPAVHLNESIPLFKLGSFQLPQHAGLRMYINETSVIDFAFDKTFYPAIKESLDRFFAEGSAEVAGA